MLLKRDGSTLQNTDTEAYLIAKKRKEIQRDREKKDALLESLNKRVIQLENQMKDVLEKLGNIYDIS